MILITSICFNNLLLKLLSNPQQRIYIHYRYLSYSSWFINRYPFIAFEKNIFKEIFIDRNWPVRC